MSTNLFGEADNNVWPAVPDPGAKKREARRRYMTPRGYAAPPGTGPKGERCGTCRFMTRKHMSKVYRKCELGRANWTGGPKTDVLAKSPACAYWQAITPEAPQPHSMPGKP